MLRGLFVLALLSAGPCLAAEDICIDPQTRAIDPRSTQALRDLLQTADQQAMQRMSGTWYSETPAPATNQVSYLYQMFEPNGLYSYRNRVCGGMTGACSEYAGTGLFALRTAGGGNYAGVIMVSDLHRDHQCLGLSGSFDDAGNFVGVDGVPWRRAR